jgi:hypothetical protein
MSVFAHHESHSCSGSPHGCCGDCQACPTCEPELIAAPCEGSPDWMRLRGGVTKQGGNR